MIMIYIYTYRDGNHTFEYTPRLFAQNFKHRSVVRKCYINKIFQIKEIYIFILEISCENNFKHSP